jgi:hypothetical protein
VPILIDQSLKYRNNAPMDIFVLQTQRSQYTHAPAEIIKAVKTPQRHGLFLFAFKDSEQTFAEIVCFVCFVAQRSEKRLRRKEPYDILISEVAMQKKRIFEGKKRLPPTKRAIRKKRWNYARFA